MAERIAILGAKGFATKTEDFEVRCFQWDKPDKIGNLSDFDTLIVNLLPLSEAGVRDRVEWAKIRQKLNILVVKDILGTDGRIILVGDPRFSIRCSATNNQEEKEEPFLTWTGLTFEWADEPGDTVVGSSPYHVVSGPIPWISEQPNALDVQSIPVRPQSVDAIPVVQSGTV